MVVPTKFVLSGPSKVRVEFAVTLTTIEPLVHFGAVPTVMEALVHYLVYNYILLL